MKRLHLLSLASFVIATPLVIATPAFAQGFDGFRVEARLGYDSPSLDVEYEDILGTATAGNNEDGLGFGAEIGYDFQIAENATLGGYLGVDFSDSDFCRPLGRIEQGCLEVRRNIYLGARGGFTVTPSTLLYAKLGYSNGQARINFDDTQDVVDDLVDSGSRDGWHFGLGVEQNFGSMFYGKLEYTYTIYSDIDFENPDFRVTLDTNRSQFMAGIGLRF
ncbi:MAG TPA: porin family protein [Allosphingosinicella sp.]|jgi:outer membrane immunogenic protein